jgi:hypothetical protein
MIGLGGNLIRPTNLSFKVKPDLRSLHGALADRNGVLVPLSAWLEHGLSTHKYKFCRDKVGSQ